MQAWMMRLIDRLRRDRLDHELEEELEWHRRQAGQDADVQGTGEREMRDAVARRRGEGARAREAAWELWSIPILDPLQQDVRLALRGMRRSPAFAAVVILTLGLGIGANVAMFNIVDRLMFRPLAYLRDPASVHRIYWQWSERGSVITTSSTQYARYLDLERWTTSFSRLAAFYERDLAIGRGESARERRVAAVSASYFDFFDARPVLGRFFTADEDVTPVGADVAVVSYAFWRSDFGGRDVRGELLQIGDFTATIIGVAPPGFGGVNDTQPVAAFVPITTYAGSTGTDDAKTYFNRYRWGFVHVLARRKAGVTVEEAEAEANVAFVRSWQAAAGDDPNRPSLDHARPHVAVSGVRPAAGPDPGLEARTALWLTIVSAIVLIIALANVANLLLARAVRRQRETAVRLALGARRRRLIRQMVTESVVLTLLGGIVAVLIAQWSFAAIGGVLIPAGGDADVITDWRTLRLTLGLALIAGIILGLVPALTAGRGDLARSLRGGARGGVAHGGRLRAALLVIQGALSVVLLAGAALFVRSLDTVRAMSMGYSADGVLLVHRIIRGQTYDDSTQVAVRRLLLGTAQSLPGVEAAAWVSSAPFVSTSWTELFVSGIDSVARLGVFTYQATTSDYFRTMGTRILRGRGLTSGDRAGAPPVAVVGESMARVLWPGQEVLGQCFRMRSEASPCMTVVGIAEDIVQRTITMPERYHYYVSIDQYTRTWGNGMVVRVRGDAVGRAEDIRQSLQRVMPGASYVTIRPLSEIVATQRRSWRLGATMFVAFGLLAVVVAGIGLYGVVGYDVAQRMHELAIRVALGARRPALVAIVVRRSVRLILVAVALGTIVALGLTGRVQPLLYGQSATDPLVYIGVSAVLLAVTILASALPAWRASRADPNAALRAE